MMRFEFESWDRKYIYDSSDPDAVRYSAIERMVALVNDIKRPCLEFEVWDMDRACYAFNMVINPVATISALDERILRAIKEYNA